MIRAMWNGVVLAEAPHTVRVEGNDYFPPESVRREFFTDSPTKTVCPWKGVARYYTVEVSGDINVDAAWYYSRPSPLARRIKNHVAFWNGVEIEGEPDEPRPIPIWRIGMVSGAFGLLCCVGPTVLALFGILSGATALAWADNLYDNYAWWFRFGGLAMLAGLTWIALRRRKQCSIDGVRRWRWRLLATVGIAVGTYAVLYALTTWLGTFANGQR
jgi:uncharacterized protein (DUF427 family)